MNAAAHPKPYPARTEKKAAATLSEWIERAALLVLLALVPLRAVLNETHSFEVMRWFRHIDAPGGARPATTVALSLLVLGIALVVAVVRLSRGGPTYRATGAELGCACVVAALIVSYSRAGQKQLALTAGLDFACLLVFFLTLRQLLLRPWQRRLTLVVVLSTGAVVIGQCLHQRFVELPETVRYFEEHRDELLRASVSPDGRQNAGLLHDYEQRLRSGLVSGYFNHPNVAASYLVLIVLTALATGLRSSSTTTMWMRAGPLLLAGLGGCALILTQSKGAMTAAMVGLFVWRLGRRMPRSWRCRAPEVLVFGGLLAWGAMVGLLHVRPEALGRSMLFRSMYWAGAWEMIRDQGPWGVGADNFGRHFTRYKSVECPEEVDSPHSWIVASASEWGLLGLAGLFLIFWGTARRLCRAAADDNTGEKPVPQHRDSIGGTSGSLVLWSAGIAILFFGSWLIQLFGAPLEYLAVVIPLPVFIWFAAFGLVGWGQANWPQFRDDPLCGLLPGLAAGLFAFAAHTSIDLAMFHPGAATTFFALLAIALSQDDGRAIAMYVPRPKAAVVLTFAGTAVLGPTVLGVFMPMSVAGACLDLARRGVSKSPGDHRLHPTTYAMYMKVPAILPYDSTALDELVDELTRRVDSVAHADEAIELAKELRKRDPDAGGPWIRLATLYYQRYELEKDVGDLQRAVDAMREAVAAYPSSPTRRIQLAGLLEKQAEVTGRRAHGQAAAQELREALAIDERRIYVSKPHRLTAQERAALAARIDRWR